ncbi:MAG TPA: hypothetical protein VHV77_14275 [Pirellulales bacterium]|jgi:hypothetical protein|nr:hypothetical protein [Pirellulales bacterium]
MAAGVGSEQTPQGRSTETWPNAHDSVATRDRWRLLWLVRALRIALEARMLLPAAAGVLLTATGWWALAWVFSGSDDPLLQNWLVGYRSCPFEVGLADARLDVPSQLDVDSQVVTGFVVAPPSPPPADLSAPPDLGRFPPVPLVGAWQQLSAPIRQLFDNRVTFVSLAFLLLSGLWTVAVWALMGGALSRMAVFELAREERISWGHAFRHAAGKWPSYFSAPLFPLLGIVLMAVPMAIIGLLGRTNIGLLLLAILWPLYLGAALLMAILLIGLLFGWPLMWATIAAESGDSFDAMNRSYSYVYQRALKYLVYIVIATILSIFGGWVVWMFATGVVHLAHWAASWGSGVGMPPDDLNAAGRWGSQLLSFWDGLVHIVALGFVYSYLWTAAAAMYLLLRQDVDGTEMNDVHLDEPVETFGLPPLKTDEAGVAGVADEVAGNGDPNVPELPKEPAPHGTGLA